MDDNDFSKLLKRMGSTEPKLRQLDPDATAIMDSMNNIDVDDISKNVEADRIKDLEKTLGKSISGDDFQKKVAMDKSMRGKELMDKAISRGSDLKRSPELISDVGNKVKEFDLGSMKNAMDNQALSKKTPINKKQGLKSLLGKLGSKVGKMGAGKAAGLALGGPLALFSQLAEASPTGQSSEDENVMMGEMQARKDYANSPAKMDKLAADKKYYEGLRNNRDDRVKETLANQAGDADMLAMLDDKEAIMDMAEADTSLEDREKEAERNLLKRKILSGMKLR